MNSVFTARYRVRSYEADFLRRLKPVSLLNYFQDAASSHAALLGFSVADLLRKRLTWMLSRYQIRVYRYPFEGEELFVRTWRSAVDGYYALRDFELIDAEERLLAVASSSWLIVSLESRRPVRIKAAVDDFPVHASRSFPDDFVTFPKRDNYERELPFLVRMGDLDQNRHVNNAVYLDWAIEATPPDIVRNYLPAEIHIAYRAEAVYGGKVLSRSAELDSPCSGIFLHQLVSEGEGKELTRLMITWQPRESLCFPESAV
ncbi:MAG: acyl-[acyl-carrier-protein] thioesterase [Geobacteraceae bacterium]